MLVLTRQRNETIIIGDDIEITVVDIRGDKVRLGINAPAHVSVYRKEVYEAIQRENKASQQVALKEQEPTPPQQLPQNPTPKPPAKRRRKKPTSGGLATYLL